MDFGKRQIGNTVILKYKKGDLPFIKVSTVSGDFSVEYGAGSVMFMLLDNAPIEDKVDNLPMLIIRNTQYVANYIDAELQVDVLKAPPLTVRMPSPYPTRRTPRLLRRKYRCMR